MAKFIFRLQRVLEYRELQADWAKKAMAQAALELAEVEFEMDRLAQNAIDSVQRSAEDVVSRLTLGDHLDALDGARRILAIQRDTCERILETARDEWQGKHSELRAMESLRETEHRAWLYLEERREAAALDEWAVMRRAA